MHLKHVFLGNGSWHVLNSRVRNRITCSDQFRRHMDAVIQFLISGFKKEMLG